jgi:hypothetical protein
MALILVGLMLIFAIVIAVFLIIFTISSKSNDSKKDDTMIKPKYKNKK